MSALQHETDRQYSTARDGRFEILRILAMLLILLQHPLERSMEHGLPDILGVTPSVNSIFAIGNL